MIRPIAISLSPNVEGDDAFNAVKMILTPWRYFKGKYIKNLEQWFRNFLSSSYAVSFNSGRSALYAVLISMDIKKGDEVILQPFTCVALPNSIIAAGAKPVYADITSNLTIDPKEIEEKITPKTKAIIVQHTFGIPSDMENILKIAEKNKINVIEDCAHEIGISYNGKKLGTFGKASIFSFGRDKAFSSVFGGMAVTNNAELGKRIRNFQKNLENPSFFWIFQQLLHPIAFSMILPFYNFFSIGKLMLVLLQKMHFLSFPVTSEEKKGKFTNKSVKKLPNALCFLSYIQLKKMNKYNTARKKIANFYLAKLKDLNLEMPVKESTSFLRFPIFVRERDRILASFKKKGIYLGKWYSEIIDPKGTDLRKLNYQIASCTKAEEASRRILNLPTYPLMEYEDVVKVVETLRMSL